MLGLRARLRRARARRAADGFLANGDAGAPSRYAWRVDELTSAHERRTLAHSLRGVVAELSPAWLPGSAPVNRPALRPQADLLVALADRLDDLERPVTPAGVVLVRELLSDGGSPLYLGGEAEGLAECLDRIHEALDAR